MAELTYGWTLVARPEQPTSLGSCRQIKLQVVMTAGIAFNDVAPVVPVRNLQAALDRYRRLGFDVRAYGHGTGYGFADRGEVSIHLSESREHDPKRSGSVVYFYVSDADAVRAEWAASGVEGRLGEPCDTEYGLREFGFVDVDGTLHRVGSRLPPEQ